MLAFIIVNKVLGQNLHLNYNSSKIFIDEINFGISIIMTTFDYVNNITQF